MDTIYNHARHPYTQLLIKAFPNLANPTDQVRTLVKFARYLHEGRFDGDVYKEELSHLNRTYHVPWARIQMMYKNREESDSAGFVLTLANLIRDIEQETFNHFVAVTADGDVQPLRDLYPGIVRRH